MSELLADVRFWLVVATGVVASWLYTYSHLRGRDWRHPASFVLGAVVFACFALGFAMYGWRGFAVLLAISALGWLGTPVVAARARRPQ